MIDFNQKFVSITAARADKLAFMVSCLNASQHRMAAVLALQQARNHKRFLAPASPSNVYSSFSRWLREGKDMLCLVSCPT
jgi:hypothetical protein